MPTSRHVFFFCTNSLKQYPVIEGSGGETAYVDGEREKRKEKLEDAEGKSDSGKKRKKKRKGVCTSPLNFYIKILSNHLYSIP